MKKAAWDHEYTSCERWSRFAKGEYHLLESFARHATQVDPPPPNKKPTTKQPQAPTGADALTPNTMAVLRPRLTAALNGLVRESESHTYLGFATLLSLH